MKRRQYITLVGGTAGPVTTGRHEIEAIAAEFRPPLLSKVLDSRPS
jgi:hypothetical protein